MKKIIKNFQYIKLNDLLSPFIFLIALIPAILLRLLYRFNKKEMWLICEDGVSARDNGYNFYQYVRTNYPNDKCYYVIDKRSKDYNKVKKYGNVIQFKSIKHWIYYLSSTYNISNHKHGNPNQPFFYIIHVVFNLFNNRVFLQHGITKDDAKWLYYKNTKFKYFICGAKQEYDYIKEKFGYPKENVVYTGFPRFDNLHENKIKENQILLMPTWRNWLGREVNHLTEQEKFTDTSYYKNWNDFLNNDSFIKYIEKNNLKVLFYPHINMQKYLREFSIKSPNIQLVSTSEDIQKLLKESIILITDYSSVFMDFAYMKKPVIYFQFDYKEYREKQYQDGYFDYKKNGFGPVVENTEALTKKFIAINENGIENKYIERMDTFFELKDKNNCKRIYELLSKE